MKNDDRQIHREWVAEGIGSRTQESHTLVTIRTQNSFTLHNTVVVRYCCTTTNVQQEMYNKRCLQLRNQNWDVLDTAAPGPSPIQKGTASNTKGN